MPTPDPRKYSPDPRLAAVVGRWRTSGHVIGEPSTPVNGTDTYELLDGGHFLVHHVDVSVGDQPVRAIEVIGERDGDAFLARSFDGDGNAQLMRVTIDEVGAFHFVGGGDIAPAAQPPTAQTMRVRSTLTVGAGGNTMSARWERSEDGTTWHDWMHIDFERPIDG